MKLKHKFLSPENLLVFILFLLLVYKIDFPRKFYNLSTLNYDKRVNKVYGFCSNYSAGFINKIQKKYKLNDLNIIKFTGSRNPYWIIPNIKKESKTNYIFIKYNLINDYHLEKINDDTFKYNFTYANNYKKVSQISFKYSDISNLDSIDIFSDSKKIFNQKVNQAIIDKDKIQIQLNKTIVEDFFNSQSSEVNYYFVPVYKVLNKDKKIKDMKIYFKNIYDLNNFKIIEQFENCYYAKKL